jgi:hypothetical protein
MFEEAEVKAGMNGWNCRCHEKFVRLLLGENKGILDMLRNVYHINSRANSSEHRRCLQHVCPSRK